jgi:branched-chain amino acid transport system permease protein
MLAITMVGIHLETVLGGLAIATRFADVAVAIIFAFIGRFGLVAMRVGYPMPVLIGATIVPWSGHLRSADRDRRAIMQLFGAEPPTETTVLQVMQVAGGAILGLRAAWLVWRQRGTMESRATRGRSLDTVSSYVQNWTSLIGPCSGLFAAALPFLFYDRSTIDLATLVLTYIMLAWGLNIIVGLAGLLDLGYVAFYAVGAYSYALLATNFGWSFWICLPLAGLLASSAGLILGFPVLRLRGDYFAIVTLGFGEIIRVILLNWFEFTGGPDGISEHPAAQPSSAWRSSPAVPRKG